MMVGLPQKNYLERFFSGSSLVTILVALVGQAAFSIVYQIRNNEQQAALIETNRVALTTLRHEIVNLQTPLSTLVLRMDGRLTGVEVEQKNMNERLSIADTATNAKIDSIDRGGTRAMEVVSESQKRLQGAIDRLQERLIVTDTRVNDVQMRGILTLQNQIDLVNQNLKRLDEQQVKIDTVLDLAKRSFTLIESHIYETTTQRKLPDQGVRRND